MMSQQASARFAVVHWAEKTWDGRPQTEVPGAKQTHAQVGYRYEGDLTGESTLHYLMQYNADGSGSFVALERFTGTLHGKAGSFVFQHVGTFEPVRAALTIIPGSATGELDGLRGTAQIELAGHAESYPLTLDYHFA